METQNDADIRALQIRVTQLESMLAAIVVTSPQGGLVMRLWELHEAQGNELALAHPVPDEQLEEVKAAAEQTRKRLKKAHALAKANGIIDAP